MWALRLYAAALAAVPVIQTKLMQRSLLNAMGKRSRLLYRKALKRQILWQIESRS